MAHQRGLLEVQYAALMKMGVDWLAMAGHLEMSETSHFVGGLLEMGCREPRFMDLAARWLQRTDDKRPWPIIAARFVAAAPFDAAVGALVAELIRWIAANPNKTAWMKITRIIDALVRTGTALPPPVTALLEALHARSTAPAWERARELQQSGASVRGKVIGVKPDFLSVELDIGLLGVLPRQRGSKIAVGEVINAAILQVNPKKGSVALGYRSARSDSEGALVTVGSVCDGRVNGVTDYGLFIRVGRQRGLLHHSKMPDPVGFRTRYPVGSVLRVRVLAINPKGLDLEFAA